MVSRCLPQHGQDSENDDEEDDKHAAKRVGDPGRADMLVLEAG